MEEYDEKWKIDTLKEEAKRYPTYQKRIRTLQDSIHVLDSKIYNLKSPKMGGVRSKTDQESIDRMLLENLSKRRALEEEKQVYVLRQAWLYTAISSIQSPAFKAILWETLIDGSSVYEVSLRYQILPDHMYKLRRKYMLEVMSEENIDLYTKLPETEDMKNL